MFKLYDTFGFPVDLTADICRERGVTHRHGRLRGGDGRSSASARAPRASSPWPPGLEYSGGKTEFRGYDKLAHCAAKVVALYREGAQVDALKSGEAGVVVLDQTPFYAESGGQVGDRGELVGAGGHLRGRRHAEDPGRRLRPPRQR